MDFVLTNDLYMRERGVLSPTDERLLTQGGGRAISMLDFVKLAKELPEEERPPGLPSDFFELTPEQFLEASKAAEQIGTRFREIAKSLLTKEMAQAVRELRCRKRYSWRALAHECYREWDTSWDPPDNQIMGLELCFVAAEILGEDCRQRPWNDL